MKPCVRKPRIAICEAGPANQKKDLKARQDADPSLIEPIVDLEAPPPGEAQQRKAGSNASTQGNGVATGEVDSPEGESSKRRSSN